MKPKDYKIDRNIAIDKTLGYKYFIDKDHPLSNKQGKVYHHRHVASVKVGRWLSDNEVVHHIDENKLNNKSNNLEIMSRSEHGKHHAPKMIVITSKCKYCKKDFKLSKSCKSRRKYCSYKCARKDSEKIKWPPTTWLKRIVKEYNYSHLSRKLGVSDNAIRKRIKNHS